MEFARTTAPSILLLATATLVGCGAESSSVGPTEAEALVVTTLAGGDGPGFDDGLGSAARFEKARGLTVAGDGTVYVADGNNGLIRTISPAGLVSTLAGRAGTFSFADGVGPSAGFSGPADVALDAAGNVFVADRANNRIRKVTPDAVVTTLAGASEPGLQNGTGSQARFNWPVGIAADALGNLYVAEVFSHRIRKVSPAGVVITFAGSGTRGFKDGVGIEAQFDSPSGIAVDDAGFVYVADVFNNAIRRISPTGDVTTLAGGPAGEEAGVGLTPPFSHPNGVAVDPAGTVYVGDTLNRTVRRITPGGVVSTLIGTGEATVRDGPTSIAAFAGPLGIALDRAGNIYVVDGGLRVRKISRQ